MWSVVQLAGLREAPATVPKNTAKEENSFGSTTIIIVQRCPEVEIAIARVSLIVWQDWGEFQYRGSKDARWTHQV